MITNGSFEDVNVCEEYEAPCCPSAWFFVAQKAAKGFYSKNTMPGTAGKNYISIDLARLNTTSRQYWETMMLCNVKAGQTYVASMQVANEDEEMPDLSSIHFLFTDSLIFSVEDTLIQSTNYLSFADAKTKLLKSNWIEIKKEFVADEEHHFLIVGNFSNKSNREILNSKKITKAYSILVDNFSIIPRDKTDCLENENLIDSLYAITQRHRINQSVTIQPDTVVAELRSQIDTLVLNSVLFDFDDYTIRNENLFNSYKQQFNPGNIKGIVVAGYTDNAGSDEYNKRLSLKRSETVGKMLSVKFGIPASIITTEGRGISTKFIDPFKNRRVEIYIYRK